MNEVSKKPLRRSTMPLDSGSLGGSSTNRVASFPTKAGTPSARRYPRPMPVSAYDLMCRCGYDLMCRSVFGES